MTTKLYVSTAQSVLEVMLNDDNTADVKRLIHDNGRYYGLDVADGKLYYMRRTSMQSSGDYDPKKTTFDELTVVDTKTYEPVTHRVMNVFDTHEVRYKDGHVWITSILPPQLVVVNPTTGAVVHRLNLNQFVPRLLRNDSPQVHRGIKDKHHFNSLRFIGDKLYILAHNWTNGSFCLQFSYPGFDEFFEKPTLLRTIPALGKCAHAVHYVDGALLTISSETSELVRLENGELQVFPIGPDNILGYCRGICVTVNRIIIGSGRIATQRGARTSGPSKLIIFDRATMSIVGSIKLGDFGNVCDLVLAE